MSATNVSRPLSDDAPRNPAWVALQSDPRWLARQAAMRAEAARRVKVDWQFDDGGRSTAVGFGGTSPTGDCGPRAAAIATGLPYADVYRELSQIQNVLAAQGTSREAMHTFLTARGWQWVPTMKIGSGCTVHLRADELPAGRLIARVSRHFVAVIDGVLRDTYDASRGGTRCVYGYWKEPANGLLHC